MAKEQTEREQADKLIAEALGAMEAMHQATDVLNQFKLALEAKGWGSAIAEQAAVTIIGPGLATVFANAMMTPPK